MKYAFFISACSVQYCDQLFWYWGQANTGYKFLNPDLNTTPAGPSTETLLVLFEYENHFRLTKRIIKSVLLKILSQKFLAMFLNMTVWVASLEILHEGGNVM